MSAVHDAVAFLIAERLSGSLDPHKRRELVQHGIAVSAEKQAFIPATLNVTTLSSADFLNNSAAIADALAKEVKQGHIVTQALLSIAKSPAPHDAPVPPGYPGPPSKPKPPAEDSVKEDTLVPKAS